MDRDELTPTLKVKRRVVAEHYAAEIQAKTETLQSAFHKVSEQMYSQAQAQQAEASANGAGDEAAGDERLELGIELLQRGAGSVGDSPASPGTFPPIALAITPDLDADDIEDLARAIPSLRTFVTLSPVPGFSAWLAF